MKKMNFFRILMSLVLALGVSSVFAQITPNNSTDIITTVTNYVEVVNDVAAESGSSVTYGAGDDSDHNYVTTSGTFDIMDLDLTSADPAVRYANASTAISHLIPVVVAPDPVINAGAWTYPTINTDNLISTWLWTVTPNATGTTDAAPGNVPSGAGEYTTLSANHTADTYLQRNLTIGSTAGNINVSVVEQSRSTDGNGTLLCSDADASQIDFVAVAPPSVAVASAGDLENCMSVVEDNIQTLTLTLTGEAPFYIGMLYTKTEDPDGTPVVTYDFREITVSAAGAASFTNDTESTEGEDIFAGNATDNGNGTWTLTVPMILDGDGDDAAEGAEATGNADYGLSNNKVTEHEFEVQYINDRISRKSDRIAAVGSPDANPETHVSYYVGADLDMVVRLYPTPVTGNIYTLPN